MALHVARSTTPPAPDRVTAIFDEVVRGETTKASEGRDVESGWRWGFMKAGRGGVRRAPLEGGGSLSNGGTRLDGRPCHVSVGHSMRCGGGRRGE